MTTLDRIERAFGHSRINEASARWIVNSVILDAYGTATSTIKNAQPLSVQCERGYKFGPVTLSRQKVVLYGRSDYSVWYGESEALRLNVLVVESKVILSHISQDPDSYMLLVDRVSRHGPSDSSGAADWPPRVNVQKSSGALPIPFQRNIDGNRERGGVRGNEY